MTDRRTPRSFRQTQTTDHGLVLPAVSPALVEWLETEFPTQVSPGAYTRDDVFKDQAEQRGQQQVIARLRTLSDNQE